MKNSIFVEESFLNQVLKIDEDGSFYLKLEDIEITFQEYIGDVMDGPIDPKPRKYYHIKPIVLTDQKIKFFDDFSFLTDKTVKFTNIEKTQIIWTSLSDGVINGGPFTLKTFVELLNVFTVNFAKEFVVDYILEHHQTFLQQEYETLKVEGAAELQRIQQEIENS